LNNEMNELDLRQILQQVVNRWRLLVALPILAAVISLIVNVLIITPQYQASTTLMVTQRVDEPQSVLHVQISRQLINTYRAIVHNKRVLDTVIANRGLPYNTDNLRNMIEVKSIRDTELITVVVTHPEPEMAREIANETASVFMQEIIDIMQVEKVNVIDVAVEQWRPVSPRVSYNVLMTFVLGAMVAFFLVFLLEHLDNTVKDPVEAQRLLGLPVIGLIPKLEETETLVTMANPRSEATEAFRMLRTNIQYSSS